MGATKAAATPGITTRTSACAQANDRRATPKEGGRGRDNLDAHQSTSPALYLNRARLIAGLMLQNLPCRIACAQALRLQHCSFSPVLWHEVQLSSTVHGRPQPQDGIRWAMGFTLYKSEVNGTYSKVRGSYVQMEICEHVDVN